MFFFSKIYFTMNSVQLVTQEKYRVKQGQNRLSAPSAQPIGPAARPGRAQAAQQVVPRARLRLLPLTCCARACLPRPLRSARASHASAHAPRAAAPRLPHALSALRPSAPRLSYRGPSGRVVGAGCAPARPYRRHSALHAPAA